MQTRGEMRSGWSRQQNKAFNQERTFKCSLPTGSLKSVWCIYKTEAIMTNGKWKTRPWMCWCLFIHWMVFFMEQLCLFADFSTESWRKKRLNAYGGSWGQWLFEELWKRKTCSFPKWNVAWRPCLCTFPDFLYTSHLISDWFFRGAVSSRCLLCSHLEMDVLGVQVLMSEEH